MQTFLVLPDNCNCRGCAVLRMGGSAHTHTDTHTHTLTHTCTHTHTHGVLHCLYSFSFSSRWHRSARKGPYALRPVSQQSPQGCPRNSANICLVEHRSFSAFKGGMSAAPFLHSSFLQAVNAVMLWLVRAEKVPQASEHLCPAKLQTRCDICCACQSICPFIPTDSGVPRTVDPQKSL